MLGWFKAVRVLGAIWILGVFGVLKVLGNWEYRYFQGLQVVRNVRINKDVRNIRFIRLITLKEVISRTLRVVRRVIRVIWMYYRYTYGTRVGPYHIRCILPSEREERGGRYTHVHASCTHSLSVSRALSLSLTL